jgi:two-component system, OmpR family, response regulator VicR
MKKILYVEDDKDISQAVNSILTFSGFNITIAQSGKECMKKAKEDFDLILLDIMLPDMSGWDIFATLRDKTKAKFAFLSAIPVSSERMEELKRVGISDYITKPFTKQDLVDRISRMLLSKKILYVEDDIDTANAVKAILINEGFHTETVYSGKECLEKVKQEYDLILLDMMLPDMSGWDIFETLNKSKIKTKFAFLSAVSASKQRVDELKNVGITDYIMKPFSREDLINRIKWIIC